MEQTILVVDDEGRSCENIHRFLQPMGYCVRTALDAKTALDSALADPPHLIITDADMPGMSGFELCRRLKQDSRTRRVPIIIISGKAVDEKSVVSGFREGADDYILKPASLPILHARLKAVLRRYQTAISSGELLRKCGIELDPARRIAKVDGKAVALTRKEFDLLTALITSEGRVLSGEFLLEDVWGYDPAIQESAHTVAVHVSRLRKKLGSKIGERLQRVTGIGYRFRE